MWRPLACAVLLASLLPLGAFAAEPLPPPPPPPPPMPAPELPPPPPPPPPALEGEGEACIPACRQGYQCSAGQCVPSSDAPVTDPAPGAKGSLVNDAGDRAPPGQHYEYRRKIGLLITGPILFGVGYGFSAFAAILSVQSGPSSVRLLNFIPVVGTVVSEVALLSSTGINFGFSTSTIFVDLLFTIATTALQATGLTLALLGIPKRQVLIDDEGRDRRRDRDPEQPRDEKLPPIQWSLAPFAPGADVGVSLLIRN